MNPISQEALGMLLGAIGGIAAIIMGIWWKVEHRQDQKIDQLHEENHSAHLLLHEKIDTLQNQTHKNQMHIMAKFEELWRNIKNGHE